MAWKVEFTKKADKQLKKLPQTVQLAMAALYRDLVVLGAMQPGWHNYSKLKGKLGHHHCHIKKGRPTYVACWLEVAGKIQVLEVYYVGTHENAPY